MIDSFIHITILHLATCCILFVDEVTENNAYSQ